VRGLLINCQSGALDETTALIFIVSCPEAPRNAIFDDPGLTAAVILNDAFKIVFFYQTIPLLTVIIGQTNQRWRQYMRITVN
jgi:hypothetical protein